MAKHDKAWTKSEYDEAMSMRQSGDTDAEIGVKLNRSEASVYGKLKRGPISVAPAERGVHVSASKDSQAVTVTTNTIRSLEGAIKAAEVDLDTWEVERWIANKWDVGANGEDGMLAMELWQVKVWLKPRADKQKIDAVKTLLDAMEKKKAPCVPRKFPKPRKGVSPKALEICVMDPHIGLRCYAPASDHDYDIDTAEQQFLWAIDRLVELTKPFAPFDEVVLPFGNDYLHADGLGHTTTAGTWQPEMDAWHNTFLRGEKLAITAIESLKQIAKVVRVYQIPGNHDRQTSFTLGRVLAAYYRQDKGVTIDASPSPYKFWRFGVNLIGYEHGHSVAPVRLAALMANERRKDWAETSYREWHLGDQHRKGSSKPSMLQEQGVSVEYLPGLTPANEWHKLKSFNWQQRGAMAFVWDKAAGPLARFSVNLDSYTGKPMGGE